MKTSTIFLSGLFFLALAPVVAGADAAATNNLPAWLAQVDAKVLPETERPAAERMVAEDVQRRLRAANERSSEEWKNMTTREGWERFRTAKITALRQSLGQPAASVPLRPRVTGTLNGEGYRIENVVFQSRPGLWVTANLYRPDKARPSMPGILISHAHHTPKEHGELQDMGVTWARAGCLVLVVDHLGAWRQLPKTLPRRRTDQPLAPRSRREALTRKEIRPQEDLGDSRKADKDPRTNLPDRKWIR